MAVGGSSTNSGPSITLLEICAVILTWNSCSNSCEIDKLGTKLGNIKSNQSTTNSKLEGVNDKLSIVANELRALRQHDLKQFQKQLQQKPVKPIAFEFPSIHQPLIQTDFESQLASRDLSCWTAIYLNAGGSPILKLQFCDVMPTQTIMSEFDRF